MRCWKKRRKTSQGSGTRPRLQVKTDSSDRSPRLTESLLSAFKNQSEATRIRRLEDRQEHSVATGFRHGVDDGKQLLAQKFRKPVSPAAVMELFDIQNACLLAGGPPLWSCRYACGNGAG